MHNIASGFAFQHYKPEQAGVSDNTAANDLGTKQISLTFRSSHTGSTTVAANHAALSAPSFFATRR